MAAERKYIDIEDDPNWAEIARAVHDSGESVVVRVGGHKLAALTPLSPADDADELSPEERHRAFMASAGSWKGLVDDEIIRDILDRSGRGRAPLSVSVLSEDEREARRERILALAGSLKDLIPDDFVEENYRQRLTPSWRETEQS
jgi:hypothetical protein